MKTAVIFYSYSGVTKGVAEKIQASLGGDLIEIRTKEPYSKITAYSLGCLRARGGDCDEIEPETIDVSGYDGIVVGTPVWAFRAAPAINAAVEALSGCDGKRAVLFATCGGKPGDTLPLLAEALEKKGVSVVDKYVLDRKDVADDEKIKNVSDAVNFAGGL